MVPPKMYRVLAGILRLVPAAYVLPSASKEAMGRPFLSIGSTSDVVNECGATLTSSL
ncbi:hypothetical protein [Friedmanniella luteola]|uniref:hypothetical protein n=1 Tax=Friedmanniella luteola TaxID=546871 RepID=UPI0018D27A57|nr:hypothetical protein [Friedmanniella luteola]